MTRRLPTLADHRYWLLVALLLAVVAFQAYLWLTRTRADEQTFAGPPRSDYTLTDFTLHALDSDGGLSFTMSGPHLARRGSDGSIFVTTPDYVLIDGSDNPWSGKSEAAWINKDGSIMKLEGPVMLDRPATQTVSEAHIETADLTTWPKARKMETAAPTRIVEPGSILRGIGMRGDLNTKELELLSDVHATFAPKTKTR